MKALFLADLHVPFLNHDALTMAIERGLEEKVDTLIVTELPDFYSVSSWNKDPNRVKNLREELVAGVGILQMLESKFEKCRRIYIPGNHDERLSLYIRRNAAALDGLPALSLPEMLGLHHGGWEYYDNKRRLMQGKKALKLGNLTILHGHEVRMGWGAVNIAKIMYERTRSNVLFGHFHRCQEWIVRKIDGQHEGSWSVGTLGELSPEYLVHNDWVHGFAIITFDQDGDFNVRNHKIIRGKVL